MQAVYSPLNTAIDLESYRGKLFIYSLHMTGNRDDAEDLTQETLLRALSNMHTLRNEDNIRGWLFRIAENVGRSIHRSNSRRPLILPSDLNGYGESGFENEYGGKGVDYRGRLEDILYIESCILSLPSRYRGVFRLNYDGFSHGEISHELGIPIGTVKSRIWRARKHINTSSSGEY